MYAHFVAIVEQFKNRIRENEQKLVPVAIVPPISARFDINLEPLGAAFSNFVRAFRSYSRAI